MGKIYGENQWGKLMGKINDTFQRWKLIENGNKIYGDFQWYFFPYWEWEKICKLMGKFHR